MRDVGRASCIESAPPLPWGGFYLSGLKIYMPTKILFSKKLNDGVYVRFDGVAEYYAHQISKVGSPNDPAGSFSMWGWINHLRGKRWWNVTIENEFINQVTCFFV
jgi:hypothetical protein